ncbi:hypothetical protein, partial [Escherichia coli]|uniref:hypothetical protein n=1 Tax=Escherichia coli TaxID=562 RepID=UPI001A7E0577
RCFNKSKGVLITGSKLKAFRNPQPSWGFSVHNKGLANKPANPFSFAFELGQVSFFPSDSDG